MLMFELSQVASTPNITTARMPPSDTVSRNTFTEKNVGASRPHSNVHQRRGLRAEAGLRHRLASRALTPRTVFGAIAFADGDAAAKNLARHGGGHFVHARIRLL